MTLHRDKEVEENVVGGEEEDVEEEHSANERAAVPKCIRVSRDLARLCSRRAQRRLDLAIVHCRLPILAGHDTHQSEHCLQGCSEVVKLVEACAKPDACEELNAKHGEHEDE